LTAKEATRIVLADDHVVLLDALAALLATQPDFRVVGQATTGQEAIELVTREQPDVLVLDLFLPAPNGFEVLRRLARTGPRVAAVVLTASESQLDYVLAVQLGARGLVRKGDSTAQLLAAIRTAAAGELAFSREVANQVVATMAAEPRAAPTSLARLSGRERQVAALVSQGRKNRDISHELRISENTVKRHLQSIFSKTGARDRLELAVLALTENSRAA
jgi:DNA-binding NarL/FixJ family response regulator